LESWRNLLAVVPEKNQTEAGTEAIAIGMTIELFCSPSQAKKQLCKRTNKQTTRGNFDRNRMPSKAAINQKHTKSLSFVSILSRLFLFLFLFCSSERFEALLQYYWVLLRSISSLVLLVLEGVR